MTTTNTILRIDSSARMQGSSSRQLADHAISHLSGQGPVRLIRRDVALGLPMLDAEWVGTKFTSVQDLSARQQAKLALSDTLIEELKDADTLVISMPIYNFGIPATLKAWIDLVARARITFKYTDSGPAGLLEGKRAIILVASGGTKVGSDIDFATPYLRHALGFIGITDVTFIAADAQSAGAAKAMASAKAQIANL